MIEKIMKAHRLIALCAVTCFVSACSLTAEDSPAARYWAHWRGPTGNSIAPHAHPPLEWSESRNVKWKKPLPGRGSGSPVVWEDKVFVVTAAAEEKKGDAKLASHEFQLYCFDRSTGDVKWKQVAKAAMPHEGSHKDHGFASASPCTDGERVYAHFGTRGLFCYDMKGGLIWKKTDFPAMDIMYDFGEGSSPTLYKDVLVVPGDHEGQSFLLLLDKKTGEERWRVEHDEPSNWVTPLVVEGGGRAQIITVGENFARSYDLANGEELWRCSGANRRPVGSPVAGHGLVVVANGHKGSWMTGLRLDGKGDITGTDKVAWKLDQHAPDIASPLLSGRRLFFGKKKGGRLSCHDAVTGKPYYKAVETGLSGNVYSSPVAANGHVYFTARDGMTVVIADSEDFKVVATNQLDEGVDATIALVDRQIFVRGEKHLYCIEEAGK